MMSNHSASPLIVTAPENEHNGIFLTPEALDFLATLVRMFSGRRDALLAARRERQARFDAGENPDFLPETAAIRADTSWRVVDPAPDLTDRRVEITGPTDRKMVINALNSGANCFMADFEDSNTPTWANMIEGQANLRDAVRRTIRFTSEEGKQYALNDRIATLIVRPRGWHLDERHVTMNGKPIPGALFDFGMYFFHNARELLNRGSGPYFYLPKLQSHLEARLWNDVFVVAQELIGVPKSSIRATVLIETLPAAFEAEEILYELRDHSAGLNCGRWDYLFSYLKTLKTRSNVILPDRAQVTMTVPFMRAYALHVIRVCHKRGAHAMGGMAAYIPVRTDPVANALALDRVRADKLREVTDGHDGTWVAHPGLVPVALEVFDAHMPAPNQISRVFDSPPPTAAELIAPSTGSITWGGLVGNIKVGVRYLESWLRGVGCVPLYNLMEDAATAEICRTQVWQWLFHGATLEDGRTISRDVFDLAFEHAMDEIGSEIGADKLNGGKFARAAALFRQLVTQETFEEFLTLRAYDDLEN